MAFWQLKTFLPVHELFFDSIKKDVFEKVFAVRKQSRERKIAQIWENIGN
jgi:hypothetical protein